MSSPRSSTSENGATIKPPDERTPLLATVPAPTSEPVETSALPEDPPDTPEDADDEDKPLPLTQIFLLCYARTVEPLAFFCIFPYINAMIYETGGIPHADVGFYSGLIESLFSATQMCVMIFWGRAADYFGRKPVLVLSLCGVTVSTALFGMSKSIRHMILFRCLAGAFSGTILTVRTMISENSTKKTQARAFSWFAFFGNLGIFFGPFIGGAFQSPAKMFPDTFGNSAFFKEYPYALPGFICTAISGSAAIISALFIKETLHVYQDKKNPNARIMSTWELIRAPGVGTVLVINSHVAVLAFAYTAVMPVFLFEPIHLGGTSFSPFWISVFMGVGGLSQALWLLFVFPPLQRRINTGGVLKVCAIAWPFFFTAWPLGNWLLRRHFNAVFWTVAPVVTVVGSGVAMAFVACQLAVNDIAPSHETLGTLNAVVIASSSGIRSIVPALSTSLYATGVRNQILGGQMFWLIMVIAAALLYLVVRYLPEKAKGKVTRREESST